MRLEISGEYVRTHVHENTRTNLVYCRFGQRCLTLEVTVLALAAPFGRTALILQPKTERHQWYMLVQGTQVLESAQQACACKQIRRWWQRVPARRCSFENFGTLTYEYRPALVRPQRLNACVCVMHSALPYKLLRSRVTIVLRRRTQRREASTRPHWTANKCEDWIHVQVHSPCATALSACAVRSRPRNQSENAAACRLGCLDLSFCAGRQRLCTDTTAAVYSTAAAAACCGKQPKPRCPAE